MRRTGAPSHVSASKRPRFCTPWAKATEKDENRSNNFSDDILQEPVPANPTPFSSLSSSPNATPFSSLSSSSNATPFSSLSSSSNPTPFSSQSSSNLLSIIQSLRNKSDPPTNESRYPQPGTTFTKEPESHAKEDPPESVVGMKFKTSMSSTAGGYNIPDAPPTSPTSSHASSNSDSYYYKVMWCKLSKKKHKTWEGDAVMVTKGRSVVLKDMEGKEIGRATGYKSSELASLVEGSSLFVGGKEIEVMGHISDEEWSSGRCFTESSACESASSYDRTVGQCSSRVMVKKGFVDPMLGRKEKLGIVNHQSKSLHNPDSANALVMPKPSSQHQLLHNPHGHPYVDVVVDPRLSKHLRPHQREGVVFLYECVVGMRAYSGQGAILADEMGLGKSLQCITLLWTLLKQGPYGGRPVVKRVIIITPGSLVKNWQKEFQKWLGFERLNVYAASTEKRPEDFIRSPIYPVLIISYELYIRHYDGLSKVKFDMVICDEGHRLKNSSIKTSSFLSSIQTPRRIVLTGTPIQNDLMEFYSLVDFCNPGVLGSVAGFRKVYEDPIVLSRQPNASEEETILGQRRAEELNRLTSLFCLRRTQEINNQYLPPKVENIVFCQPSRLQLVLYRKLLSSRLLRSCLVSSNRDSSPHLVCIGALKKLCNSPSLVHSAAANSDQDQLYDRIMDCFPEGHRQDGCNVQDCGKLEVLAAMLEYLRRRGFRQNKIVLVSNYTQTLDILQSLCEKCGYNFLRLDGQTPSAKRLELVDRFNRKTSQEFVFLLSSKAGGVGLNLTGASHLVLYDIDWNPANDLQAMARVWRDGQANTVHIYRLLTTGTIEEKIFQRQVTKQGLSVVMDGDSNRDMKKKNKSKAASNIQFSLEELKDLFSLHESSDCATHDQLDCECNGLLVTTEAEQSGDFVDEDDQSGFDFDQSRLCALGRSSDNRSADKNLSIDQLKKWKHFGSPFSSQLIKDEALLHASTKITFIMQNEIQTQNL